MNLNVYPQNNNPYTPGGHDRQKLKKALLIGGGIFTFIIVVLIIQLARPESQQSKDINSATAAARQKTPGAKVKDVKVADGFAIANVRDPNAEGQAAIGSQAIFKINKNGSMTQIAAASTFSSIDLLNLGIPVRTQAKLIKKDVVYVTQSIGDQCGYDYQTPGYIGFDNSFNPDGWQIDSTTLDNLQNALSPIINAQNSKAKPGKTVMCINALRDNSNLETDDVTYVTTFTLEVQFVNNDGTTTKHTVTFALGPGNYTNYTLDGKEIQNSTPKSTYSI